MSAMQLYEGQTFAKKTFVSKWRWTESNLVRGEWQSEGLVAQKAVELKPFLPRISTLLGPEKLSFLQEASR